MKNVLKRENNLKKINRMNFKYTFIILLIQIFFVKANKSKLRNINYDSYIIISIKGNGTQSILYKYFIKPNQIIINGIPQNYKDTYVYNLTKEDNNITIIWDHQLNTSFKMFCGLSNIKIIDLSNFDTSEITSMQSLFEECSSLISLNLKNLNTSLVKL